jgi:zinc transport system substrate-binding protein
MNAAASGFAFLLAVLFLLLAGCITDEAAPPGEGGRIVVGVTILPLQEFVEAVGGDRVEVMAMVPPGANPATYEPTIDQLVRISDARMYVKVGAPLPFETIYLDRLVAANPGMLMVDASEGVGIVENDPHIWTSPQNAMVMVDNIEGGLEEVDPAHAAEYRRNAAIYREGLEALDEEIRTVVTAGNTTSFMVYHPAWGYFARDYGLTQIAIERDGKEPSAHQIQQLIETAHAENLSVVFASPQFSTRSAEVIADQIDGRVVLADPLGLPYCENLRTFAEQVTAGESIP